MYRIFNILVAWQTNLYLLLSSPSSQYSWSVQSSCPVWLKGKKWHWPYTLCFWFLPLLQNQQYKSLLVKKPVNSSLLIHLVPTQLIFFNSSTWWRIIWRKCNVLIKNVFVENLVFQKCQQLVFVTVRSLLRGPGTQQA